MPDNFFVASERMYDSSKVLHESNQFHNACYLAGYVLECYGKILIEKAMGGRPKDYGHDLRKMDTELGYFLTSSSAGGGSFRKYYFDSAVQCPGLRGGMAGAGIDGWNPFNRYSDSVNWGQIASGHFQNEREICFEKIVEMYIDGVI